MTPSSFSHQVAGLERWVGAPLFERSARQVRLTAIGRALSADLNVAMEMTFASLSRARREAADTVLHVSASPLFTNAWLTARLARFQDAHPDMVLQIETTDEPPSFEGDRPDVTIRAVLEPPSGDRRAQTDRPARHPALHRSACVFIGPRPVDLAK